MHKRIADHKRRVARLNRYVFVVALLWVVTSFALLLLSGSHHSNSAGPVQPPALDHAVYTIAAVAVDSGVLPPVS
jgi:preprotein translocase subunit SecG